MMMMMMMMACQPWAEHFCPPIRLWRLPLSSSSVNSSPKAYSASSASKLNMPRGQLLSLSAIEWFQTLARQLAASGAPSQLGWWAQLAQPFLPTNQALRSHIGWSCSQMPKNARPTRRVKPVSCLPQFPPESTSSSLVASAVAAQLGWRTAAHQSGPGYV